MDGLETVKAAIAGSDVVLFMKGTPGAPRCGFSAQVVQVLGVLGVPYSSVDVLADDDVREAVKRHAGWPTIPQLYLKGEFVGGCDIVREMFETGELEALIVEKGIAVAA